MCVNLKVSTTCFCAFSMLNTNCMIEGSGQCSSLERDCAIEAKEGKQIIPVHVILYNHLSHLYLPPPKILYCA